MLAHSTARLVLLSVAAIPVGACQLLLSVDGRDVRATRDADAGADAPDAAPSANDGAAPTFEAPKPLANATGVVAVALAGGRAYWSQQADDAGALFVESTDGGAPRVLLGGETEPPNELSPGPDRVYFARTRFCSTSLISVGEASAPSGDLSTVAGCSQSVVRFSGNGRDFYAYLFGAEFPKIAHFALNKEGNLIVSAERAQYGAVTTTDEGDVIYVDEAAGAIVRSGGGGGATTVAPAMWVSDLDNDALYTYWITTRGVVARCDKRTSQVTELQRGLGPLQRLAVRHGAAYVTEATPSTGTGRVLRIGPGGELSVIAEATGEPFDIAVDDVRVVWTDRARATVYEARLR